MKKIVCVQFNVKGKITIDIFFFRFTMVTFAIMFHNPILILTLWASLLRF